MGKESKYGPVMTCGAVGVSFNHRSGEPTSIDKMVSAIKRLAVG